MTTYKSPFGFDVSIRITREEDTAYVEVIAPMYVRKSWRMDHCYSTAFSDHEILKDSTLNTVLAKAYRE